MDKIYTIGDFARRIGRSASTVRRWEREGLLKHNQPSADNQKNDRFSDELSLIPFSCKNPQGNPLRKITQDYMIFGKFSCGKEDIDADWLHASVETGWFPMSGSSTGRINYGWSGSREDL
jgi:hypothetical protein